MLHPGHVGDVPEVARFGCSVDHRLDRVVVREIGLDGMDDSSGIHVVGEIDGPVEAVLVDVSRDHRETVRRERDRRCTTDSRRRTRDDGNRFGGEMFVVEDEKVTGC